MYLAGLERLKAIVGFNIHRGCLAIGERPSADALSVRRLAAEHPAARLVVGLDRVTLLVGAEGAGLSKATLARADERLRIPMVPGVDSINVATAAAIALHRLWRGPSGERG